MDLSQMRYGTDDTYIVVASGGEGGSNAIAGTAPPIRAAAVSARQALLGLAAAQFGVPAASLTVSKGVISGGGFQSTYGQLLGGKLFNVSMPPSYNMAEVGGFGPPTGLVAGQAPAKAIASYKLVGTSPPRIDIPGQGDRHLHLRPERARGRDDARPRRSSPRAGCLGSRGPDPLGRPELDLAHPGRAGRAEGELPRGCRPGGMERDPGGRAAEGDLAGRPDPAGQREPVLGDEGCDDPRRGADELGRPGRWARLRGQDARCQLLLPLQRAPADRADVLRRRRHAGADDDLLEHTGHREPGEHRRERPRHHPEPGSRPLLRGLGLLRLEHPGGRRRVGRDHVAGDRQAGAGPVHALGRARLGLLRARAHRRPDRRDRCQREHRLLQLQRLADPVLHPAHDPTSCSGSRPRTRARASPASGTSTRATRVASTRSRTGR